MKIGLLIFFGAFAISLGAEDDNDVWLVATGGDASKPWWSLVNVVHLKPADLGEYQDPYTLRTALDYMLGNYRLSASKLARRLQNRNPVTHLKDIDLKRPDGAVVRTLENLLADNMACTIRVALPLGASYALTANDLVKHPSILEIEPMGNEAVDVFLKLSNALALKRRSEISGASMKVTRRRLATVDRRSTTDAIETLWRDQIFAGFDLISVSYTPRVGCLFIRVDNKKKAQFSELIRSEFAGKF